MYTRGGNFVPQIFHGVTVRHPIIYAPSLAQYPKFFTVQNIYL